MLEYDELYLYINSSGIKSTRRFTFALKINDSTPAFYYLEL